MLQARLICAIFASPWRSPGRTAAAAEPRLPPRVVTGAPVLDAVRDPEGNSRRVQGGGVALTFSASQAAEPGVFALGNSPLLPPAWSSAAHYARVSARCGGVAAIDSPRTRRTR